MHLTDAQIIAGLKACKKLDAYSLTDHQIAMVFRKAVEMSEIPPDPWKDAVLQACMMTESGFMEADPALSVRNLIHWHTQLATDVAAPPATQAAEPVAWLVYVPSEQCQYVFDSQDDTEYLEVVTNNADARVTPLHTPQAETSATASGDAEREALIERLKAQSLAHRYEAETDSADLIDEAVAALHSTGNPDGEVARRTALHTAQHLQGLLHADTLSAAKDTCGALVAMLAAAPAAPAVAPEPLTDQRKALSELVAMVDAYTTSPELAALQEHRVMRNARAALAGFSAPTAAQGLTDQATPPYASPKRPWWHSPGY